MRRWLGPGPPRMLDGECRSDEQAASRARCQTAGTLRPTMTAVGIVVPSATMALVGFDIDGTMRIGDPPGPVSLEIVRERNDEGMKWEAPRTGRRSSSVALGKSWYRRRFRQPQTLPRGDLGEVP